MKRSIRVALLVGVVALAVPAVALAWHHGGRHGHGPGAPGWTGATGASGGAGSVQSYDPQSGALTIGLAGGGTITATVNDGTRFECLRPHWGRGWGRGGRWGTLLLPGDTGSSGASGDSGASGASGDSGASGASGDTGASGSTGSSGASGATGSTGTEGGEPHHHHHGFGGYGPPPPCDSSLLTMGAGIERAVVDVTPAGAFFEGIELIPAVQ